MDNKQEQKLPARQIRITVGVNEYEVKFPKNGQLIDIESMKIQLSSGTNKDMLFGSPSAREAYMILEAIATFEVLIPDLRKDLQVKSLLDLDPLQSKTLKKAYEQYYDWMDQWRKVLNEEVDEKQPTNDSSTTDSPVE